MAVVINTNVDSLKIQNVLTKSTNSLSQTMQRMSTGLKVNSAKDDAAGTVISARMNVQLKGNQICQNNIQNANAMMSTAEGNLDVVEDNLSRIRDLILQAKNGTYSDDEKRAMQDEISARTAEIDRISESAKYSDLQLFGGALDGNGVSFQVGANATTDDVIQIKATDGLFKGVKFKDLTGLETNFRIVAKKVDADTTADTADTPAVTADTPAVTADTEEGGAGGGDTLTDLTTALNALDKGINDITARKSLIGSTQNRLESALSTLTTQYTNLSSAKSIITDADIASEASKYTQAQILQQVSTSLLAQANQAPAVALSLV